jgi:hypothetical protein
MVINSLEEACKSLGAIHISQYDEKLFRERTEIERTTNNYDFKDSWKYVIQASRYFPYVIENQSNLLILGAKKDKSAIVIPNYFVRSYNDLSEMVQGIIDKTNLSIILKNVSLEEVESLRKVGFDMYSEKEFWDKSCKYDDQTFPQRIVNIEKLLDLKGGKYKNLRRVLRLFKKNNPNILVSRYIEKDHKKSISRLLKNRDLEIEAFSEAYQAILKMDLNGNDHCQILKTNDVIGFSLSDKISKSCVAFSTIIHDSSIPNLSSFIAYETAKIAQIQGYKYFNFQGSETKGLDQWKRKFNPQISLEKTHMILNP